MVTVCCPVCGEELNPGNGALRCRSGHTFDIARQGYVNLLPVSQKHSRFPGDTPEQVAARRAFFETGIYEPVARKLTELCMNYSHGSVLDVGCGEGYYLSYLQSHLEIGDAVGVDVSKAAARFAAAKNKNAHFFTATAAHLPFPDQSFDLITAMFSLTVPAEYRRLLKQSGAFVRVTAGREHLMGLKRIIYPVVTEKEAELPETVPGFCLDRAETLEFEFELKDNEYIMQLLRMTPHWLRINADGLARARDTEYLKDMAQVRFCVYVPERTETEHA